MHIERMTTRQSRSVIRVASPGPRAGLVEVPAGGLELAPELVDLAAQLPGFRGGTSTVCHHGSRACPASARLAADVA